MTATPSVTAEREQSRVETEPERAHLRLDIQGLRALAVLAVILNHLTEWPAGAFVGVDVFFVISGFLITGMLLREYESTDRISFLGFYRKRFKRIVPAATLVLAVTVAASFVLLSTDRFLATVKDAIAAFFFTANWRFEAVGTDYFQEGLPPSPLQHYWSLSVEEQFYFVWPWLLLGLMILGVRRLGWAHRSLRAVAGTSIAVVVVASFGWAMLLTESEPTSAYFSTLTRVWELGVGALVAVVAPWLAVRALVLRTLLAWIGLVSIVASMFMISESEGFPAPWAAVPVLATALVIAAGIGGEQPGTWPLVSRPAEYIGDLSYSLYLWHFPVIILLAAVVETETLEFYTIAVVLIAGLSAASYHLFEDPVRHAEWAERGRGLRIYLADGWRFVWIGALAIVVGAMAAYALMPGRITPPATSPFAIDDTTLSERIGEDPEPPPCVGAAALAPGSTCQLNSSPSFYPPVSQMTDDVARAYNCWIDEGQPMRSCTYGDTGRNALRVALVGDSHAAMLLPALEEVSSELGIRVDTYLGFGCQWKVGGNETACAAAADIRDAIADGGYDAVIAQGYRSSSGEDPTLYSQVWAPVAADGAKVIVVVDNPEVSGSALECVRRVGFDPLKDDCATARSEAVADSDVLVRAAADVEGAGVIDLTDYFCTDDKCPAVVGNVMVYRDEVSHITGTFARSLAPYLSERLTPLLTQAGR